MATGLAIDTSDLDIAIYGVITQKELEGSHEPKYLIISAMERLHEQLNCLAWVESNQLISTASVPVIKLVIDFEKLADKDKVFEEGAIKKMKVDLIFNDILKCKL